MKTDLSHNCAKICFLHFHTVVLLSNSKVFVYSICRSYISVHGISKTCFNLQGCSIYMLSFSCQLFLRYSFHRGGESRVLFCFVFGNYADCSKSHTVVEIICFRITLTHQPSSSLSVLVLCLRCPRCVRPPVTFSLANGPLARYFCSSSFRFPWQCLFNVAQNI